MSYGQTDLFAQDDAERNTLSQSQRAAIRSRLEATLAKLEAAATSMAFATGRGPEALRSRARVEPCTSSMTMYATSASRPVSYVVIGGLLLAFVVWVVRRRRQRARAMPAK